MPRRMRWIGVLSVVLLGLTAAPAGATYDYVSSWGGNGTAQDKFHAPGAIAVGLNHVYTVDYELDRVQEWTESGHFVRSWGSFGADAGELNSPEDIATGRVANVYVADTGNSRVAEYTEDGFFLRTWGTHGTGNRQFDTPAGIAVAHLNNTDHVYVADTGNNRVQEFGYSGGFIRTFGGSHLHTPIGIAISPTSRDVYVGNAGNNRIAQFTRSGTFVRSWAMTGTLHPPNTIDVDYLGRVYVGDKHGILVYGPKGAFITRWGDTGYGPNNLFEVWGLGLDQAYEGYVYAGDNRYRGTLLHQGIKKFHIVYPGTEIVFGPKNDTTTADPTPTFAFTSSAQNPTFQCQLDSGSWSACTSPHTTAPLADGPHTFEVRTIDSQGLPDVNPSTRMFTVDTTP